MKTAAQEARAAAVAAALKESDRALDAVLNDPGASDWLKSAIVRLKERDPLDALHDTEYLAQLLRARFDALMKPWQS